MHNEFNALERMAGGGTRLCETSAPLIGKSSPDRSAEESPSPAGGIEDAVVFNSLASRRASQSSEIITSGADENVPNEDDACPSIDMDRSSMHFNEINGEYPASSIPMAVLHAVSSSSNTVNVTTESEHTMSCSSVLLDDNQDNSRFMLFMRNHARLVGLQVRHGGVTEALMTDLLKDEHCEQYISWRGVKGALTTHSGLRFQDYLCCPSGHGALKRRDNGSFASCSTAKCAARPNRFTYIFLWDRLKVWLQDKVLGPMLLHGYEERVRGAYGEEEKVFRDFYSGRLFEEAAQKMGGLNGVVNRIFLSVSTDGVQAFNSSQHSYWPIVLQVLNLPPSRRSKLANILPVVIVPGPNAPTDVVSFMEPLFQELEELHEGRRVRLWNGKTEKIAVDLFFTEGDLQAMDKLTNLVGANGYCPCRYCTIFGRYSPPHRHHYFPDEYTEAGSTGGRERTVSKELYNARSLPLRDEESFMEALNTRRKAEADGRKKEAQELSKRAGVKSGDLTEVVRRMPFMRAFRSFPIDIMHLLYQNVAKNIVGIWMGGVSELGELAVLKEKETLRLVNESLSNAGVGISSIVRRPRVLDKKGQWKASEWKFFVHCTSVPVLQDVIPDSMLKGWWSFVQLCELVNRWELLEEDARRIGRLSVYFFEHFMKEYYRKDPSRLHICKYVYHLLLHLEECIRDCGPVSLVSMGDGGIYWGPESKMQSNTPSCRIYYRKY